MEERCLIARLEEKESLSCNVNGTGLKSKTGERDFYDGHKHSNTNQSLGTL